MVVKQNLWLYEREQRLFSTQIMINFGIGWHNYKQFMALWREQRHYVHKLLLIVVNLGCCGEN